ncbi:MAG: hypothetical protein MRJ65_08100 [Candidatus Brocadiaceae bacterium]|nr:hypothetical protein [Candidatus Brocadiaceae bacterium]
MHDSNDQNKPAASREKSSSGSRDTIITPLKITVKEEKTTYLPRTQKNFLKRLPVVVFLIVFITGGLLLCNYLSKNPVNTLSVSKKRIAPVQQSRELSTTGSISPPVEDIEEKQIAEEQKKAEQMLAAFLLSEKELISKGVAKWGGELYERVIRLSKAADDSLIHKKFSEASENYAKAMALLKELHDGIDDTFQRIIGQGLLALKEGDGTLAQQLFRTALMIEPGNEFARHTLERAEKIEMVMALIASGMNHEKKNDPSSAYADYQEAVRLAPESEEAQAALSRVKNQIAADQFQQLMSAGFIALNNNDYKRAQSLFLEAESFKPDSPEVKDALSQVNASIRLALIGELQKKALKAESSDDWEQAISSYQAVLRIDDSIQFAIEGRYRSMQRNQLDKRINYYLEKPSLLESDSNLKEATELIREAEQTESKSHHFHQRYSRLVELVKAAQIPIQVTIESDNMTEVIIYKVGRLGSFHTREIQVRSGTYTIVGIRNGFKDVRQNFSVKVGEGPLRIIIKCSEKI